MSKAEIYHKYLTDEGYRPTIDKDGDVLFKYEGGSYYVIANEDDPMYFQVLYPNFWAIEKPEDADKAYRAAGDATRATKVAKVFLNEARDKVSADVEVYMKDQTDGQVFLERAIAAIRHAVGEFVKGMGK